MGRLRRLVSPPRFLAFAWAVPPCACSVRSRAASGATLLGPGIFLLRRPRAANFGWRGRDLPGSWGILCVHALLLDPGEPHAPRHYGTRDFAFRANNYVGSAFISISRLYHTACTLPVYASQPWSPTVHATLGSGGWLALAEQDSHLLDSSRRFLSCFSYMRPPSPGLAWRNLRNIEDGAREPTKLANAPSGP